MGAAGFAARGFCTQPINSHGIAHHLPSTHTVLLQAECILLEGVRCTAINAVLCLIASADEDKSLELHLQLQVGSVKACTQLLSNTDDAPTQGRTCCVGYSLPLMRSDSNKVVLPDALRTH